MTISAAASLIVAELAKDHDIRRVVMDASAGASAMVTASVTHFGQSEIGAFVFYGGAAIVLFRLIASGLEAATKVASVIGRVMRKGE
jgi:hypothetical protein